MKSSATGAHTGRTFSSAAYLAELMGELDRAAICARIKQAREEAGLTQAELGEAIEPPVHWRTIQTWESVKEPRVPWDKLDQIARVTARTKEWLLHGADAGEPDPVALRELRDELARRHDDIIRRLDELASNQRTLMARVDGLLPRG